MNNNNITSFLNNHARFPDHCKLLARSLHTLSPNITVRHSLTCLDLGTVTGMSFTKPLAAVIYNPLEKGSMPLDPFEGKKCFMVIDA